MNTHAPRQMALAALCLLTLEGAQAQATEESRFGLGLGVAYGQPAYREADTKASPVPYIIHETRWTSVVGPIYDIKAFSTPSLSLRLRSRYGFGEGYQADDSPYLTDMATRKRSFWLGGAAVWQTPFATVSADLLGDASRKSKGSRFSLAVERRFASGRFDLTPRLAVQGLDRRFVDYYYGVRTSEATSQRRAYTGQSTINTELALSIGYALAPGQRLMFDLSNTQLGAGITDSPLVQRSNLTSARLGYLYMF